MDVTVAICTYGHAEWAHLARSRALPSVREQGYRYLLVHQPEGTLHGARNEALQRVDTEWVIYLDADDELEPGYIERMAEELPGDGRDYLVVPRVRYVNSFGVPRDPYFPRVAGHTHACVDDCLRDGNWMVIGTAARADQLRRVGGWRDFAWSEDWDMWIRCWLDGARALLSPRSVYRAHVRRDSRNRAPSRQFRNEVHRQIYDANFSRVTA